MDTIASIIGFASLVAWIMTRHPFFCLPLLVAGSLLLEDDAYPFSHFPMYSNPDESENYFYLAEPAADGSDEIKALPVRTLTGLTAPKLKKMYKRYLDDYAKERDMKRDELSDEVRAAIGEEILVYYREQGEKRGSEMPDTLILMEVWIVFDDENAGFTETTAEVARQSVAPAAPAEPAAPVEASPAAAR